MKVLPLPVAICTNAQGATLRQRPLQIEDRPFLYRPEGTGVQRRQLGEPLGAGSAQRDTCRRAQLRRWLAGSAAGATPTQRASAPGVWNAKTSRLRGSGSSRLVKRVSEPRGFVEERQRLRMGGHNIRQAVAVLAGLRLNTGERIAGRFRFHDAGRFLIDVQQVISGTVAGFQVELANRDAQAP